jgi:hypothetical protein
MYAQKCLAQWVDSDEMAEELADFGNFTQRKSWDSAIRKWRFPVMGVPKNEWFIMGNPWEIPLKWKLLVIKTGKPK